MNDNNKNEKYELIEQALQGSVGGGVISACSICYIELCSNEICVTSAK